MTTKCRHLCIQVASFPGSSAYESLGTRLVSREPKYRGLDGEATEYMLCKHCGCMLNTDYISQVAQRKLTHMQPRNRNFVA